jgi:hypothetical protein
MTAAILVLSARAENSNIANEYIGKIMRAETPERAVQAARKLTVLAFQRLAPMMIIKGLWRAGFG